MPAEPPDPAGLGDSEGHGECVGNWLGQLALGFDIEHDREAVPVPCRSRPSLRPGYRTRILMRDMARCVICNSNCELEVGHLIPVSIGRRLGLSDELLFSAENLAAMCRVCNRDLGSGCPPLAFMIAVMRARRFGSRD